MNRLIDSYRNLVGGSHRIISVLSGKGGVGKSVVSFNLADRLAAGGKRVLLVDADFNFGNLHIIANAAAEYGLMELLSGKLTLPESTTRVTDRLDILASASTASSNIGADLEKASSLISSLRKSAGDYDLIIIDHASGTSEAATLIAHGSDLALLVLVPELTSISDCYGLFKRLIETNAALDCRVLINRAESAEEADYITRKFSALADRFLGRAPEFVGWLPDDKIFKSALAGQLPIAAIDPQSVAVEMVTGLGQTLSKVLGMTENPRKNAHRKGYNETAAKADIRE